MSTYVYSKLPTSVLKQPTEPGGLKVCKIDRWDRELLHICSASNIEEADKSFEAHTGIKAATDGITVEIIRKKV